MIAPFHDLWEANSHTWTKKLVSCGNAIEQNAQLNHTINTNTTTNTTYNNNYNPTSNTKKWPNNNIPLKSVPKLSSKQDEYVLYSVRQK